MARFASNLCFVVGSNGDWPGLGTAVSRQLIGLGTAVPAAGWDCRGLGTAVISSDLRLNGTGSGTAVEKNEGLQSPVLDCVWLGHTHARTLLSAHRSRVASVLTRYTVS